MQECRLSKDTEGGEEGEGELHGESNIEIYKTICKIDSQQEFVVWLRELKQGLWDRLKGGMEGGGKEVGRKGRLVYLWLIFVDMTENHKIL